MPIISSWRDGLSIATMVFGIATMIAGIAACVMLIPPFPMVFYIVSAATVVCFVLCIVTRTPLNKAAFGLVPFAVFWVLVLCVMLFEPRISGVGYSRGYTINNAKQITLALHIHNDVHRTLPTNQRGPNGEEILSWRVLILPYLDQGGLYKSFNLKEPWDGPTNKPLLSTGSGLSVYRSIYDYDHASGNTPWQCFVGAGTAFEADGRKLNFKDDFPKGLANTILFVECKDMVPWSKPADIPFGPDIPLPALGGEYYKTTPPPFAGYVLDPGFHAAMADGSVRFLSSDISEDVLRAMILRKGEGFALPADR